MNKFNPHLAKVRGMVSYGLGPVLGLISGPILARALGPTGRGQFASVMEPLTLAAAIASFGIPSAITYFISQGHNPKHVLKIGFLIGIIPTLFICALMWVYSGPVSASQNLPRGFVAGAWTFVLISVVIQLRRAFWQGSAGWLVLDTERGIYSVLRFIAVVVAALLGAHSATIFVLVQLAMILVGGVILWLPWKRDTHHIPQKVPQRSFLRYSTLAAVGTIAMVANNRLDQVLMPAQTSSAQMGFYAVAVTIAEIPLVFATLASRDTLQMSGAGKSIKQILRHNAIYIVGALVSSVCLGFGASWYLPLFFGTEFNPAITAIHLLSIGTGLTTVAVVAISFIAGKGAPTFSSLVPVSGLFVTLVAFQIYWTKVDATVASWISLAAQGSAAIVGLILTWVVLRKRQPLDASTNSH